ncbi:hypothetical protein CPB84DRAFT_1738241 [Gymnopilus junonius]|uniref:Uncharacterized protein n=1 Tax=Gymnopilus junonius TaxID=109634 RepID=A0A9P5N6Z8_GYMJU|nr:hypothetical protein CPB84DRAFT_1738241 [Gymnopilus junonius]
MSSDNSTTTPLDDHYVDSINLVSSTTVASTAYGMMVTLYLICCYYLKLQMTHQKQRGRSIFFICYISAMFIFGTIYIVTTTQATTVSYVYYADFPGGPSNYNNLVLFSAPVGIVNTISYVLANWLADALLLWRLLVLYQGTRESYKNLVVAFPALIYLGSLAMGFMFIIQTSVPNGSLWANGEINFALPYFVLSVSMSVIATGLMLWRVLSFKKRIEQVLGAEQSGPYVSISAILVESCALYATFSLIFIILFATNNPIQYVFLSALANVQIIAALLVIFRVSQNKAWSRSTTERTLTSVHFKHSTTGQIETTDNSSTLKMKPIHISNSTTLVTQVAYKSNQQAFLNLLYGISKCGLNYILQFFGLHDRIL